MMAKALSTQGFCPLLSAGAPGVLSISLLIAGEIEPRHLVDTESPLEVLCQPWAPAFFLSDGFSLTRL